MTKIPFTTRNGINATTIIENDLPKDSRVAVFIILNRMIVDGYIAGGWEAVYDELCRSCRFEFEYIDYNDYMEAFREKMYASAWERVFVFLERIYVSYIKDVYEYDRNGNRVEIEISAEEIRNKYIEEINTIMLEDNIAYEFIDGEFFRRGRAVTNKNIERTGLILSDIKLERVKTHYSKALIYFRKTKNPDYENSVKEAFCALEIAIEIITGKKVAKNFSAVIRQLKGNNERKIPEPIIDALVKVYGYRNSGLAVSHGAEKGLRVSVFEVELILNLVSSYIVYIYDYFNSLENEELPF